MRKLLIVAVLVVMTLAMALNAYAAGPGCGKMRNQGNNCSFAGNQCGQSYAVNRTGACGNMSNGICTTDGTCVNQEDCPNYTSCPRNGN